jgi:hypothetical protein
MAESTGTKKRGDRKKRARGDGKKRDAKEETGFDVDFEEFEAVEEDTARTAADGAETKETVGVCPVGFCPVAMTLSAVQTSAPDAVAHLLSAGREFLLAAKAVLDQRAEEVAGSSRLEKIDIT